MLFVGMMGMTEYKLEELFDLQMGKTPARNELSYWDSDDYRWISIGDLSRCGKYITETKEFITEKAVRDSGISLIPANTVIMSFKLSIGKTAITGEPMYSNEAIMSFRDRHITDLLPDYIYYLLSGRDWDEGTNKAVMGKTLNKATLSKFKVKIHDVEHQRKIVSVLDKVSSVIEERQQQLAALDDLVKARFVEMFGDPISNEKLWKTAPLTAVCSKIYGGGTPSKGIPEYFEGSIPWVSPKDMKLDVITDSIDHITEEAITNSTTNLVPAGSVLMVIRSGILKHSLPVAINAVSVAINQDMKAFVPGENITASFLRNYFKAIEPDILAGVRGVTADNIDFKSFQQREILIPPIYLQRSFEDFYKQIDKSKDGTDAYTSCHILSVRRFDVVLVDNGVVHGGVDL